MKKLFIILIIFSFQVSYANWEVTSWKSGERIYSIWAQDSVLILDGIKGRHVSPTIRGLTISLDSGKTFPIAYPTPDDVYFTDVVIAGKSLYIVGPGDLWRSDDWGASWTSKGNGLLENLSISKLLVVEDQLFAATFLGLYVSSDKGETWQNLQNGINPKARIVNIAKYKDKLILLKDRNQFSNDVGVYFSTDNGNSWVDRADNHFKYTSYNKLVFIGDTIIVGSAPGDKGQFFNYSTDDGITWNHFLNDVLSVTSSYDVKSIGTKLLFLRDELYYTSSVDWRTWTQKNEELPRPLSVRINNLVVDKNRVFASSGSELWVSYDSAETWRPIITGKNYGNIYCIASYGDAVFAATSSFEYASTYPDAVFTTTDRGETWTPKGIKNGDIRSLISSGNIIIADGADHKSYISPDRGNNWHELNSAIHPRTLAQEFAIIGETIFAIDSAKRIMKSDDFGATWIPKSSGLPEINYRTTSLYAFGNKLFALSDRRLYVSENLGESWELFGTKFNAFGSTLDTRIAAEGSMIAVSYDSQCYLSSDNGQSWKNITGRLEIAERHFVSQLAIKDGVVYLAMYEMGFLVSPDSGKTLILKNDELPKKNQSGDNPFAFHNNYIYLGINYGNYGLDEMAIYRAKISDFLSAPDEKKEQLQLTIAPNPATDFISLSSFAPGERIEIYSQLGVKVLETNRVKERIDVSALPAGIYFLKAGGRAGKFIKTQ